MTGVTDGSPRIAFTRHGDRGPRVLMIMGMGMRGRVWRPQVEELSRDHRLVTFDNRGVGDSEEAPGAWGMKDMAGDALRVMDAAGWDRAHVVGVSMGGMIAQELALAAPSRVTSLTLIATHAGGPSSRVPPLRGVRGFLQVNLLPPEERHHALAYLLYPADYLRVADRGAMARRMEEQLGSRPSPRTRLGQLRAVMTHDTRSRLASLRMPVQTIRAGRDGLVSPREQARLASLVPGDDDVLYDFAGHGLIFQCARAINARLRRWFAAHETASVSMSSHGSV